jgi:hypothetical protein
MSEKTINQGARRGLSRPVPPERGDEAALFLEHQRFLLRVTARRFGGSQELAEDACAFAWLQLLRCPPDREAVVGWLRVRRAQRGPPAASHQPARAVPRGPAGSAKRPRHLTPDLWSSRRREAR